MPEKLLKKLPIMIIEMTAGDKIISRVEGYSNKKIFRNHEKICGNKTPICSRYEIKTFAELPIYETNIQHVKNRLAEKHSRTNFADFIAAAGRRARQRLLVIKMKIFNNFEYGNRFCDEKTSNSFDILSAENIFAAIFFAQK